MYPPNKFVDGAESVTSPRTFPKDVRLEQEVQDNDFALGHLLNLIQLRLCAARGGTSLQADIALGTPTSNFGLGQWMAAWQHQGATMRCSQTCLPQ